jgi:hyperosmotically inducible protein
MHIDGKRLVLGVTLAGALSVLIAGCGRQDEQAAQPASPPAATSQAAPASEPASTAQPATTTAETASATKPATTTVGTEIDDGVITTKVKAALLADADIKSLDIGVETNKGNVQLSGVVDSQDQIDQAVAIAKKVDGVTSVGNQMSIKK